MQNNWLYSLIRFFSSLFVKIIIRPTVTGLERVPKEGRVILAGNHTSNLDCILLIGCVSRQVHFLAKNELFTSKLGWLYKRLDLIPVLRNGRDHAALESAYQYLESDEVIGIFPEGTTSKGRGLLPFKRGACQMSLHTNSAIVPFVIKGNYFKRDLSIEFLEEFYSSEDVDASTRKLRDLFEKRLGE